MSTRGWESATLADLARLQQKQPASAKPSKYRNVKTEVLGIVFDSKREAAEYLRLHARQRCGEISHLRRQVAYPLMCPTAASGVGVNAVVAHYIADFVYEEHGITHVVDAKGFRTKEFRLKCRWLELQTGIHIEEV